MAEGVPGRPPPRPVLPERQDKRRDVVPRRTPQTSEVVQWPSTLPPTLAGLLRMRADWLQLPPPDTVCWRKCRGAASCSRLFSLWSSRPSSPGPGAGARAAFARCSKNALLSNGAPLRVATDDDAGRWAHECRRRGVCMFIHCYTLTLRENRGL
jgi:hypothetical protein